MIEEKERQKEIVRNGLILRRQQEERANHEMGNLLIFIYLVHFVSTCELLIKNMLRNEIRNQLLYSMQEFDDDDDNNIIMINPFTRRLEVYYQADDDDN